LILHRIDSGEIYDAEEENSCSKRYRSVTLSRFVDLGFSNFRILDSLINFCSEFLGSLQLVYECLVHENLCYFACSGETAKNRIFNFN
jgi:hypothetical protein